MQWPPQTIKALKWKDVLDFYASLSKQSKGKLWVFRGEGNHTWKLKTTLERTMNRFGEPLDKAYEREKGLLREFQRHFHHYTQYRPKDDDTVEWLAMMQHHYAPTRLLDWTYSFYVALYFALEATERMAAVLAIDVKWCTDRAMKSLSRLDITIPSREKGKYTPGEIKRLADSGKSVPFGKDGPAFNKVFQDKRLKLARFVYPMNPFLLNERMVAQQGLFLCPRDISTRFHENLMEMEPDARVLKRLIIPKEAKDQILRELYRMNITNASLFPGLDGFAKSLGPRLVIPESLYPGNSDT